MNYITTYDRFVGCLLGGACGDALGYPVEFLSKRMIDRIYGNNGIVKFSLEKGSGVAAISDDTQMTLFTANGLLLSKMRETDLRECLWTAYKRWYFTQDGVVQRRYLKRRTNEPKPFIMDQGKLFVQRSPGMTCLFALSGEQRGTPESPLNDSKGCGGVMRVAPCGLLFCDSPDSAYSAAVTAAALTHGHYMGYIAAGVLARLIARITMGESLTAATEEVIVYLSHVKHAESLIDLLRVVLRYARLKNELSPDAAIRALGHGWVADEALAIALYCALIGNSAEESIIAAVNHDGDSDSTGAICGNIVGALYGVNGLPGDWWYQVEQWNYIKEVAGQLYDLRFRVKFQSNIQ